MSRLTLVVILHLAATTPVLAAENPALLGSIGRITSDAWTVSGVESFLELTDSGLGGEFRIARVVLRKSNQVFDNLRIVCGAINLTTRTVTCEQAAFTATIPGLGRQTLSGAFTYDRYAGNTDIELPDVSIAGGLAQFDIRASGAGIDVQFAGTKLQLGELLELASKFSDALVKYSGSGIADVSGTLNAPINGPLRIVLEADIDETALANDAGTIAADNVAGILDLDITFDAASTTVSLVFDSAQGEAYVEPAYADFSAHSFHLQADDIVTPDFEFFDARHFKLKQESLLDAEGSATWRLPVDDNVPVEITADIELSNSSVDTLYTSAAKIQLAGTALGDLDTDGRLSGSISIVANSLRSASLQLDRLILDDRQGRFAVYGLNGFVDWSADEEDLLSASHLRWDSGTAYNIIVDSGEVDLQLGDNDIEMLAPVRLKTMGGALLVNRFALHNFGSEDATGVLDAELEPIQLGQLAGAFGWPAFSGTLSGRLPLLQLAENIVTVGGALSANAFDGKIDVSELRIEQPFGRVPRMLGKMTIRGLDLQRVTEAFSFGLIQGRLSGDIAGLELQNWRPVAMDLHFYTPADDKTQRRISQRAVENLASVGGSGAAAVLSTGFLQFFEVFAYDRIGLRCLLRNGVCAMSGAGPAKAGPQGRGYYIVKGRGIPRIDVVGYRDTVSWPRLMQQLAAITRSGSPTVN
jgi:hypothetical protein